MQGTVVVVDGRGLGCATAEHLGEALVPGLDRQQACRSPPAAAAAPSRPAGGQASMGRTGSVASEWAASLSRIAPVTRSVAGRNDIS